MNARRLLMVADKLQALPRDRFNYGSWVGGDWAGKQDLSCGTTACALGWAATIPALRRAGLRLAFRTDGSYNPGYVKIKGSRRAHDRTDGNLSSIKAAMRVFDLTEEEASYLFLPDHYGNEMPIVSTAKQVARHIRHFVVGKSKPTTTARTVAPAYVPRMLDYGHIW